MSQTLDLVTLDGVRTTLSPDALQAFRGGFRGRLVTAADADYGEARSIWNGMIDRRPGLIAYCSGVADVAQAVRFAGAHRLLVSVRGGGHNVAGLSVCEGGLLIDLSAMRGVWVDPARRLARAQAGCLLADVDRETQVHGLAAVLGFVSATGIAGLTTGGGFGYLTRRAGWTCDNVVSMEVVTAEGQVVRASESEHPDLFWALRGGGGSFGIVTSFEYRLHPVGPTIVGGGVAWRAEDAPAVLRFFRETARAAPRELTLVAALRLAPPAPWIPREHHAQPMVAIFACHSGDPAEGERLVSPIKSFGKPIADILVRRPYAQMQSLLDATALKGRRYYQKSEYFADVGDDANEVAVKQLASIPSPHSAIMLFHIEGALGELPPHHSPAGNRDAAFVLNLAGGWDEPAEDQRNIGWVRDTWSALKGFGTGGAYYNFQSEDEGTDRLVAAYGALNLERLATIKRRYDPGNLFRHSKSISA